MNQSNECADDLDDNKIKAKDLNFFKKTLKKS